MSSNILGVSALSSRQGGMSRGEGGAGGAGIVCVFWGRGGGAQAAAPNNAGSSTQQGVGMAVQGPTRSRRHRSSRNLYFERLGVSRCWCCRGLESSNV